jgi:hypothetical protein
MIYLKKRRLGRSEVDLVQRHVQRCERDDKEGKRTSAEERGLKEGRAKEGRAKEGRGEEEEPVLTEKRDQPHEDKKE